MRSTSADVVVIGAGTVGASIAYESARRGASVIVLDEGPDIGNGCSYANAGLLAPSHVEPLTTPANVMAGMRYMFQPDSPFHMHPAPRLAPWFARFVRSSGATRARELTARMQELAVHSTRLHAEYAERGLDTGYRANGALDVFLTERALNNATAGLHTDVEQSEVLTGGEARDREPALGPVAGAIFRPDEAQVGSQQFVGAALQAARSHGAEIRWSTRASLVPAARDRIAGVDTPEGRIVAGTYVVAAGLGSRRLCESVGIRMPMEGAKGYVVDAEVDGDGPRIPLSFRESKVVATPYADRLRLCGTLELGGDPRSVNASRVAAIRAAGQRGLPGVRFRRTLQTWAGLRPCTADGVPSIGRSAVRRDLVVAAGHGMWGLVLAPVTGELLARGIVDDAPTMREAAFSPDRFGPLRNSSSLRAGRPVLAARAAAQLVNPPTRMSMRQREEPK
ncbi:D-amino-acid dehydrogenase [Lipingzhangella halophila]|uniref:D-amino-acid dehydrogenase n=1 Tax=Lipingzhangella halophila TaxID=1783352 RepID=A0A7W7W5Q4_9ACTN|nr:FAD-dependent oxidoreductase [Lipingzhangella halophila]MBB4935026.1 D-amino-acid dehydrogenase [Lipingzhangella halophila]